MIYRLYSNRIIYPQMSRDGRTKIDVVGGEYRQTECQDGEGKCFSVLTGCFGSAGWGSGVCGFFD